MYYAEIIYEYKKNKGFKMLYHITNLITLNLPLSNHIKHCSEKSFKYITCKHTLSHVNLNPQSNRSGVGTVAAVEAMTSTLVWVFQKPLDSFKP